MAEFFETIAREKSHLPLMAAWVMEGQSAGARALFAWDGRRYVEAFRDAAFPEDVARSLGGWDRDSDGILAASDGARVFVERLPVERRLVICGAGHVALCAIRLAATLGYDVTAIEDREAFAETARIAGARQVICKPFAEALDEIDGGPGTAFVVMTREHAHDMDCLRKILKKPCAYAGVMGSRSRAMQVREQLLEEGFDIKAVKRLHMPIGLQIGARTPEEIAVSVMAELISVMNDLDTGEGFPEGLLEALTQGQSGILAMIVAKRGEAPRRPGTKMLVKADGSFIGTVGGGLAEAEILRMAGEIIRGGNGECRVATISMKKGDMQCGGEIEVLLLPV